MAARAAAEAEVEANNAALDKTLPAPPVPSRRLLGAQEIFKDNTADTSTDVPRTPSLSALSLLRPPQRHDQQPLPKQEEDGPDALERRLVEQDGTRCLVPPPAAAAQAADPPPAPVPLPIAVSRAEVPNGGAEMNESAISSLALGAEESFGGRNGNGNGHSAAAAEDLDAELEVEDLLDARTQRLSKGGATAGGGGGGGGSSGSERGTHKARSRKSFKSDRDRDRGKEREEKKAMRKKRDGGRGEEAVRMKRAAKGRVAEWLEKLASPEQEPEQEPKPEPEPEPESAPAPSPLESKPNPRSLGFISVTTLRRAPISLPQPADSTPDAQQAPRKNVLPIRRIANRYPPPPPSQVEMKYNVKSARGGRGGRVTAVASIWAEASKGGAAAAAPKVLPPKPKPKPKASHPDLFISRGRAPTPAKSEDAPARAPAQRALFGLGVAAAATPSSPALSSSIATPVLSSTASLAQPPGAPRTRARARAITPMPEPETESAPVPVADSRRSPSPQLQQQQQQQGWKAPLVSGAGLKADLAFGQARLRDLIRRYQGQAT